MAVGRALKYPITGIPGCCARAKSGQATAEPTIPLTKSRRRIAYPKAQDHADFQKGSGIYDRRNRVRPSILRSNNHQDRMSALGQKQTLGHVQSMSALPPKADITEHNLHVR